jgi:hypothetical protein
VGSTAFAVKISPQTESTINSRLKKGLPVNLAHIVSVSKSPRQRWEDIHTFGCRFTFDPWDEVIRISARSGTDQSQLTLKGSSLKLEPTSPCVRWKSREQLTFATARVTTQLDVVDADQMERTRRWLAERGIGSEGTGMFGRALSAMIDLKGPKRRRRLSALWRHLNESVAKTYKDHR